MVHIGKLENSTLVDQTVSHEGGRERASKGLLCGVLDGPGGGTSAGMD